MMLENKHQNLCEYADELVSYLYEEIGETEKMRFEAHLPKCALCAAELTDFSTVRSSIIEWCEAEFQQLATPVTQLPVQKATFRPSVSESGSLLAQIRALFSLSPAWAGAATAAALVICLGLLLVAINFQRERDVTRVEKEAITEVVSSPKEETAELKAADSIKDNEAVSKESSKSPIIETKQIKSKREDVPVKVLQPAAVKDKKANAEKTVKQSKPVMRKLNQSPPPTLLADEDEIEDDSLRLSDIFKEVGTR